MLVLHHDLAQGLDTPAGHAVCSVPVEVFQEPDGLVAGGEGRALGLAGFLPRRTGLLQAGQREVEEAVGAVGLGETLHSTLRWKPGSSDSMTMAYWKSLRQRTAAASCQSDRPSTNCSTQAVAGWAGERPGRLSRG